MNRPAAVIRPPIEPGHRVVAISDVHGNLPFLKGLLERVALTPDDVLILVGDLLEKGRDSLATLRYVMELQRKYTVYPLCGNCDYIDHMFLEGGKPGDSAFHIQMTARYGSRPDRASVDEMLWPVLSDYWREQSVLLQMAAEAGIPVPGRLQELPALRSACWTIFPKRRPS